VPEVGPLSVKLGVGAAAIDLGEGLDIAVRKTVSGAVEEGDYDIHSTNNLVGAQLGARWRRTWGRFGWEATGKAGVFGNEARQTQTVDDFLLARRDIPPRARSLEQIASPIPAIMKIARNTINSQ